MLKGKIKKLIDDRLFGFIQMDDGKEIFFHGSSLQDNHWNDLAIDADVEFETESSPKGDRAINVRLAQ